MITAQELRLKKVNELVEKTEWLKKEVEEIEKELIGCTGCIKHSILYLSEEMQRVLYDVVSAHGYKINTSYTYSTATRQNTATHFVVSF